MVKQKQSKGSSSTHAFWSSSSLPMCWLMVFKTPTLEPIMSSWSSCARISSWNIKNGAGQGYHLICLLIQKSLLKAKDIWLHPHLSTLTFTMTNSFFQMSTRCLNSWWTFKSYLQPMARHYLLLLIGLINVMLIGSLHFCIKTSISILGSTRTIRS